MYRDYLTLKIPIDFVQCPTHKDEGSNIQRLTVT